MSRPIWKFREKQPAEIHQESAHTEFFADQYVADRLVRESGQNTLDASLNGGPTRLVFTFTEAPAESFEHYLKGLWPHLEEQPELRASLPHPLQPIPALVVEDFGTTGLTGPLDVRGDLAESNEPDHRLYWFFKNIGRTSKSGDQLGSFGIGKTVFPYSSRINTFFGFSTRLKSDGVPTSVLLGQAHLREHRLPASGDLDPIGFFAWQEGSGAGYVQRPISEEDHLEHFRNTFGLTRQSAETGLSVVIPYPDTELGAQAVGRAVLEHFFLPILSGRLAVEIRSTSGMLLELSTTTLLRAVEHLGWTTDQSELIRKRIELARWAYTERMSGVPLKPAALRNL